jgi:mono/diheme cytochrome c family protein
MKKPTIKITFLVFLIALAFNCKKQENSPQEQTKNSQENSFGVGPIQTKIELGAIDNGLAQKGEKLFNEKCTACHKIEERYVGPALKGVTKRRGPEWIMNMILDPMKMTQEDPQAKELLAEYLTQMTNQNVSQEDARAILEYFRKIDAQ